MIYMSRVKFVMLGLLAALALSAFASAAPASAHEFFVNTKAVAEKEKVEMVGNTIGHRQPQFELIQKGTILHIQCQRVTLSKFTLGFAGSIVLSLLLSGCTSTTVVNQLAVLHPTCKIGNGGEIKVEAEGKITTAGEVALTPKGSIVIEEAIEKAGACATAGTYTLAGESKCTLPHYSVEAAVAAIECNPAGSTLKTEIGAEKTSAKFYGSFAFAGAAGQKVASN
jgi:hypothetical protein